MINFEVVKTIFSDVQTHFQETSEYFSETRDVFTARLQSYVIATKSYLESAVIGEFGNNAFDHNFIFAKGSPRGVYCNFSYLREYVVLADYGRGVRQSLLPVLPELKTDQEAVKTAFTMRISGRSPEQRGNGLKFASETIRQNNWHLYFQSGIGTCLIDKTGISYAESAAHVLGCLVIIKFGGE
jgi:hypothetical protein